MTVIKRGNSYWIDIGFDRKRIRKRSPDNSYKGAKAYEALIRQKLARGKPLEEQKPLMKHRFKEIALQWLEIYVKNNNKPSEYVNKRNILNNTLIPFFGNYYITDIKTQDIENYKAYLLGTRKLSPKSINNYLSILSKCLKTAFESEILASIPRIRLLKVAPQKFDYLTEAETELLLQSAKGMWHDLILLAVRTGLRFGELIALKYEDIDFKSQTITIRRNMVRGIEGSPKNNRIRTVPLTKSVIEMLYKKSSTNEYIFRVSEGKPLYYTLCLKQLHKICRLAGLRKISWHVLRHTFASHLAAKGISIFAIKELLGHSDIKMTMRYSHVNLPILRSAIDVLEPAIKFNGTITAQLQVRDSSLKSNYSQISNLPEENQKIGIQSDLMKLSG